REIRLNWFFLRNITRSLWIGGEVLMVRNRFPGEFEDGSPDFLNNSGGWVTGAGPSVMFDNRHRTLAPTKGALVEIAPLFVGTGGAGDHKYNRITVDARHYFPSFGDGSAMAFQFIFDYAGQDAPFYEIPQLGGKERLRGIGHPLRKTGNAVWLARGELRQPVWWRFGAVVFAEAGRASDGYNNPFDEVIGSFGGGLRFRILPDDPLNVRFDAGVSTMGTTGFYISLKEAF
ncbi:MAG: BamA/TamA family outer membrane protein, partial [Marinilabilia sp.]